MGKNEDILKVLRDRIIRLEYSPGAILNEQELADEFNVSRSPVRLALQELEREGLIDIVARYGAQVKPLDFKSMKDLFELTRSLDPFATRLAVGRINEGQIKELEEIIEELENINTNEGYKDAIILDERFHEIIFEACSNKWVQTSIKSLHFHTERLWHYCKDYFTDMTIFTRTFKLILKAIKENKPDEAEKFAREHIDDFVSTIKESLF